MHSSIGFPQNYILNVLYRAYFFNNAISRKLIRLKITRIDGGEMRSLMLRKIFSKFHEIDIGLYSYGCFALGDIPAGTKIGRYCSFARNTVLISGNHPYRFKSLHPYFYNSDLKYVDELKIVRSKFIIEHDVWIGMNAIVLPSAAHIHTGAVIGAGSVVTHDVPPFAIVAGNPAKIIKYRFSEKTINKILDSKWWELDIDQIKNNSKMFQEFTVPVE